jgi:hypothetical protein
MSAASILPATGTGLLLLNNTDPVIVDAMFVISAISLVELFGSITRFIINMVRFSKN